MFALLTENMKSVKNIIFDYGNVIFDIDFRKAQEAFTNLGVQNVASIFAHADQDPLFDQLDKGLITGEEFRDGVRILSGVEGLTDMDIDKAWNSLLLGVPKGNHEVLLEMKKKYRTFLLSNNNEIHYAWIMAYLESNYGYADNSAFFEKDYYSHLLGMRKPNKDIFEFILDKEGLVPSETLFIDDSPQHLETAKRLGLRTILFNNPKELKGLMVDLGL